MTKPYVAITAAIFALVALIHVVRLVQGWQVQVAIKPHPDVRVMGRARHRSRAGDLGRYPASALRQGGSWD